MNINDWISKQNAFYKSIQSAVTSNDFIARANAMQASINSAVTSNDFIARANAMQVSINSVVTSNDFIARANAMQASINSVVTSNDFIARANAMQASINSAVASNDFIARANAMQASINSAVASFDFSKLYSQLNTSNISEINEVISEYSDLDTTNTNSTIINEESASNKTTQIKIYTEAELTEFVDSRIEESQNSKSFIKTLAEEVKLNYGVEAVKWLISSLLFPFLYFIYGLSIENHEVIIDMIQESIKNGIYVVGYTNAKQFVRKNGLSRYENINHIGILRVDSTIRVSNSKVSSLVITNTIKANTVVNIIKRKRNWIKIETKTGDYSISGWIEESKIIKFKRKK
ncbi:hypothetical protein [Lysinibacillus xylanilyticus]|uniref:hypothetical protein n=1 Tax=Lysinibacillus xylanilyticus TaxID=582475 RepID=UPI0037FAA8BF